jgi:hypothetical protein
MVKFPKHHILKAMNLWPPFLGAGIKVMKIASDFRSVHVQMRLRFWNQNYVGVHYGGSLYSMTDPFFMLMVMECLGQDYIVWDKAASIRFRRPGRGLVTAHFHVSDEALETIRREVAQGGRSVPTFTARVLDQEGKVVAEVDKTLSVRARASTDETL